MLLRRVPVRRIFALPRPRWNSTLPPKPPASSPPPTDPEASKQPEPEVDMAQKLREMAEADLDGEYAEDVQQTANDEADNETLQRILRQAIDDVGFTENDFVKQPKAWKELQPEQPAQTEEAMFNASTKRRPAPEEPVEEAVEDDGYLDASEMEAAAALLPLPEDSLPENPTEEQFSATLVHGRSFQKPVRHPQTHNVPVAIIQFRSYHVPLLDLFTHFARHAAASLAIPVSGVVMLPNKRSLWTVPKAPFAYKKAQENFERIEHKRAIKAWDADEEVILRWVKYLERHNMAGVGMRIVRWERLPLGLKGWAGLESKPKHKDKAVHSEPLLTTDGDKIKELSGEILKSTA